MYALGAFAIFFAPKLQSSLRLIPYEGLSHIRSFPGGTFIFSDLDRLPPSDRHQLETLAAAIDAGGGRSLNHPVRTLLRFPLLRLLHDKGLNRFNVYRLDDWRDVRRFPVFIRHENAHDRPPTDLLSDMPALEAAIRSVRRSRPDATDLMIVEFGNAAGEDGRYRKFSAMRVGDEIYAQSLAASRNWWIKYSTADSDEALLREELAYARANPHRAQLETIFALSGADYGRIDYCVVDGRVQSFEINTNPTIIFANYGGETSLEIYARPHERALCRLLEGRRPCGEFVNPLYQESAKEMNVEAVHDMMAVMLRKRLKPRDISALVR